MTSDHQPNPPDWFADRLLTWYRAHGRHDLPWQLPISPYRVWVSEVMLQQTQVATVIGYFERFMASFPSLTALADASIDQVLHHWSGLGYYARGRNLHKAAKIVVELHNGDLPDDLEQLLALPGIGRSTAGAILAIAFDQHAAILDGNVKRVLCRFHEVTGHPGERAVEKQLWSIAQAHTPTSNTAAYTQAIMDLGATLCTRRNPRCGECPLQQGCQAYGSDTAHQLPTPRNKVAKPTRKQVIYLICDERWALLLQQRPAAGLWGGLYSPPERPEGTSIAAVLGELGIDGTSVASTLTLPEVSHTFTHFKLAATPMVVRLNHRPRLISDGDTAHHWMLPDETPELGLSAFAVKLRRVLTESRL